MPSQTTQRIENHLALRRNDLLKLAPNPELLEEIFITALQAIDRNERLQKCGVHSIYASICEAVQLGLYCNGVGGDGWLAACYNHQIERDVCVFIPGYQGLIKLCHLHPHVLAIEAKVVREKDKFKVIEGTDPQLIHHPHQFASKGGAITHAYCVSELSDGQGGTFPTFTVMDIHEINQVRQMSEQRDGWGWTHFEPEMCRKSSARRHMKYLPKGKELTRAIELDNAFIATPGQKHQAAPAERESRVQSLRDKLIPTQPES